MSSWEDRFREGLHKAFRSDTFHRIVIQDERFQSHRARELRAEIATYYGKSGLLVNIVVPPESVRCIYQVGDLDPEFDAATDLADEEEVRHAVTC